MKTIKSLNLYKGMIIVVDMVNGFVREGVLHDEEIAKVIPRQIELIKEAKAKGNAVVFFKDTHDEDAAEFDRFGGGGHCVRGTREAEIVDELKPFVNDEDTYVFEKNSTSFMEAPEFRKFMEEQVELNEFDIAGCCTDICDFNGAMGLANYLDQWNRKHIIRAHEDAMATYAEGARQNYVDAAKLLMEQQVKEKPGIEFYEVMKQLSKIGVNLNQIAHKANATNNIDKEYYKKEADNWNKFAREVKNKFL